MASSFCFTIGLAFVSTCAGACLPARRVAFLSERSFRRLRFISDEQRSHYCGYSVDNDSGYSGEAVRIEKRQHHISESFLFIFEKRSCTTTIQTLSPNAVDSGPFIVDKAIWVVL